MQNSEISESIQSPVNRRSFLKNVGGTTAAIAALGFAPSALMGQSTTNTIAVDTPKEIFTAALIAEDLATTFYYNGLIGKVIQDVNLAGPGGTAFNATNGSATNVAYIRAALTEEVKHATLFRTLLGISKSSMDPYQTFYFPTGSFDTLNSFINLLEALEFAFIGAYMAAVQQLALRAAGGAQTLDGVSYQASDFAYFAKVASSILGVESEHRALGRAINPNIIPANDLTYEKTDGIQTVYNGSNSAVAALTPFLTPTSSNKGYSLKDALYHAEIIGITTYGNIPSE